MLLSVVILNYNVKYFLDACLQSVQKAINDIDAEIIVADNNSTDGSEAYFSNKYPGIKFLYFDKNHGFAKANNLAVKHAQGKYLLILNPDTLVSEDSFEKLLSFAKTKEKMGIVGVKFIDGTGRFLPESKRGVPTPIVAFSKFVGLYKFFKFAPFNRYYACHLKENETGKADILTGAFMFMEKSVFDEVGGFDERYFMYGEDIDFSYTVLQTGRNNYYFHQTKILHFKGESSRKDKKYAQRFFDTTFQFYEKHFRSFPVSKFLIKSFIKLWLKFRIFSDQNETSKNFINSIFYVGKDTEKLQRLKNKFPDIRHQKDLKFIVENKEKFGMSKLIFDTESFKDIFDLMEKLKSESVSFRFIPDNRNFFIGSDTKDGLGEVDFY